MKFLSGRFLVALLILILLGQLAWVKLYASSVALPPFFLEFDALLHFGGGMLTGLVGLRWLRERLGTDVDVRRTYVAIIGMLGFVALVGVSWEIYEFLLDRFFSSALGFSNQPSLADTISDLFFDIFGGAAALLLSLRAALTLRRQ